MIINGRTRNKYIIIKIPILKILFIILIRHRNNTVVNIEQIETEPKYKVLLFSVATLQINNQMHLVIEE